MQTQMTPGAEQKQLMDAVGFTLKGLEANRAGVLSVSQQAHLKGISTKASRLAVACAVASATILVVFGAFTLLFQAPP